jgi:hypothetical protein
MGFLRKENFQLGAIYLDDPTVGSHSFTYGNEAFFDYPTQNPGGNVYTIQIRLA